MNTPYRIALADDDAYFRRLLESAVSRLPEAKGQVHIQVFKNGDSLLAGLAPDTRLLFLDYFLDGGYDEADYTAPELMERVRLHCPNCEIVVVSGHAPRLRQENPTLFGAEIWDKCPELPFRAQSLVQLHLRAWQRKRASSQIRQRTEVKRLIK